MESEVQEAEEVPRSELDAAFSKCGDGRWMVVQSMSSAAWGYELSPVDGADIWAPWCPISALVGLS